MNFLKNAGSTYNYKEATVLSNRILNNKCIAKSDGDY